MASSIQFTLGHRDIGDVVARAAADGVTLKWFGAPEPTGFTSRSDHWRYADEQPLPRASAILGATLDMRIPLTFSVADCDTIAELIVEAYEEVSQRS